MTPTPLNVFTCPLGGTRLIEASAGTGKTWNICALYLRLLLERQLDVQQILVVTFTKAATAELRERIRSRIVQTLDELRAPGTAAAAGDPFVGQLLSSLRGVHALGDEAMRLRLDAALQAFDEASIFTIHSFCQRALGDAPFTAGVPMKLEAMQDDSELVMEVVHDFWRRHVAADTTSPALVAHLLSRKDTPERLAKLLKRQLAKPLSKLIWPADLDTAAAVDITALSTAHAGARAWWRQEREVILGWVDAARPFMHKSHFNPTAVATAAANWDKALASADPLAASPKLEKLDLFAKRRLKSTGKHVLPAHHPFFALAEQVLDLREAADTALDLDRLRLLRTLLTDGPAALRQLKRDRRVIAFDDMLYNLHERLTSIDSPDLAATLKARFPAALIDEFQDTDPLQFAVFQTLYGDGASPLFLVGDPKQAIYSFRNADLPTYLQARAGAAEVYTLSENQRSTAPLLRGLNALFERNDRAFMRAGLAYQPVACGAKPRQALVDATEPRAPLQLWSLPQDDAGEPWAKPQAMRCSMEACAGEIARLIGAAQQGHITLAGRALAAGDIAVLVHSHAHGSQMRRALAELGVGSVELSQASVFASTDAEELERVLAAILEPTRERLLRAALATELMGRDAAAIEAISGNELELLALIKRCADHRELWLKRGVGVMLRRWMVDEQVSQRLLARADGERRMTNLLHLCECLHEASQGASGHASPEALLRWLHNQRTQGRRDDATQLRLESDRNLVQIVTVHKAKGLEYPIVFCPALWDGRPAGVPSGLDGKEYHDELDQPVVDFRPDFDKSVDIGGVIKQKLAIETAAETLRLIYVALTRAVHRCYLVVGSYTNKAFNTTSPTEANRSLLNWLAAGQGQEPEAWLKAKPSSAQIAAAWSQLAADHAPDIDLSPLPIAPFAPLAPQRPAPDTLAALDPPDSIPKAWRIGSYSSLAHGTQHEGAAVDHDLRAGETTPPPTPLPVAAPFNAADDDILRFPRGPVAGECMHTVFERADFTDLQTWDGAIATGLRLHPQSLRPGQINGDAATLLPAMLGRMLGDVLHTPLPGGFTLADVPLQRRLVELEFSLPAQHLSAGDLATAMRAHGYPVPALEFGSLEGYLRGFIDLVFEHDGRFYVLDWKSNHLGDGPDQYGQTHLMAAMTGNGYHLQYLLYAVAVHRYLQQRMAGYQYDTHFGGVLYLFVRGVRPSWRDAAGAATGVYAHKPTLACVQRLSGLL
jgi:exodeoxyribonuclease V beta subunit